MPSLPTLDTGPIRLRPWAPTDRDALVAGMNDPDIVRWLDVALPYTHEDADRFIGATSSRWEEGSEAHFAVAEAGTDALVGYLGVLPVDHTSPAFEFVYWVAPHARGGGIAGMALAAAVRWAQEALSPTRLELGMAVGNEASAAVARRCGFTLREILLDATTLDGAPADEWIFELANEAHESG